MSDPEAPRPGNWDKAWNDPPLFSYNAVTRGSGGEPLKLNKRVGFPATWAGASAGASASPAPPVAAAVGSAPPPPLPDAGAPSSSSERPPPPPPSVFGSGPPPRLNAPSPDAPAATASYACEAVVDQLAQCLAASSLEERRRQDIAKRIETLRARWSSGGLNPAVEAGVGRLADLLARGQAAEAERVQRALMVDWPALCHPWLVGVKHLIASYATPSPPDPTNPE